MKLEKKHVIPLVAFVYKDVFVGFFCFFYNTPFTNYFHLLHLVHFFVVMKQYFYAYFIYFIEFCNSQEVVSLHIFSKNQSRDHERRFDEICTIFSGRLVQYYIFPFNNAA